MTSVPCGWFCLSIVTNGLRIELPTCRIIEAQENWLDRTPEGHSVQSEGQPTDNVSIDLSSWTLKPHNSRDPKSLLETVAVLYY